MLGSPTPLEASPTHLVPTTSPVAASDVQRERASRGNFRASLFREVIRILFLAVVSTLIWIAHCNRWTAASWHLPTQYSGDAYETLARLQAASEGDTLIFRSQVIERLGAPFGAHWNAYPTPDKLLMSTLGLLVPVFGLYFAANVGLMLAQVSSALAFYIVARVLRCRWEWACAGGLIFSYTYHTFHRGLAHFSLLFTWTVPLGLLAVWLIAGSRRLQWRSLNTGLCLLAATGLGFSNPYNLFFWLQLMAWALVAQLFGQRRQKNLAIGITAIALAIGTCAATNSEHWLHVDDTSARPVLERNYAGTETYALKPVEMVIPPAGHSWDFFASFGQRYLAWSHWKGEGVTPYLGIAGIVGFCWLGIVAVRRGLSRKGLPPQAMVVGWILAYASVGGITNVLAMFAGLQIFRATNRAAIFVSAIAVWWLVAGLSRFTRRLSAPVRLAMAFGVAGLAVFEQLPRVAPDRFEAVQRSVRSDRDFGLQLESALGANAMVFQLPRLDFPEVLPPNRMTDYEHFRPYLATRTLRFSYGSPRRRARDRWQADLQNAPPAQLIPTLEDCGFSAVYLNRKAYEDHGDALLRRIARLGYCRRIDSRDGEQVAVLLHPKPRAQLPVAHRLTVGRGWKIRPDGAPWAYDDGALSYYNPYANPITVELHLTLTSRLHRRLTLELDGNRLRDIDVAAQTTRIVIPGISLRRGIRCFHVRSRESVEERGDVPNEIRAFGLTDASVNPTSVVAKY